MSCDNYIDLGSFLSCSTELYLPIVINTPTAIARLLFNGTGREVRLIKGGAGYEGYVILSKVLNENYTYTLQIIGDITKQPIDMFVYSFTIIPQMPLQN